MNSVEILDKKNQLKEEVRELTEKCKTEIRMLDEKEQERIEEIKEEIKALNSELEKIEKENEVTDEDEQSDDKENNQDKEENKTMEKKSFSLLQAIRNVSNNKAQDELTSKVIEAGQAEMRKSGINFVGQIQLPNVENRAAITVASEGEDVVATDLFDVLKPLQAKNVMINAGAKFVTNLIGDLQYPVMSNGSVTWEGETAEAQDGSPTFTSVKLSPKRLTAIVPISKQFLIQDGVGAELAIRQEIVDAINAKLEETILGSAQGSATQPEGIFYNGGSPLGTVTTFANLTDMEAEMEEANVYGETKYLISPKAKSALRNMAKSTKSTQLVYENGEVDGTTALSTSHIKNKNIAYGDFSQYIIANWGNIDLTVDSITLASQGQIRLIVNAYFDAKPLRAEAIKVATLA